MTYSIRNSRGDVITTIADKGVDSTSTSLVLHGSGKSPYGTRRNENIVHLLENFSNTAAPSNPIDGQLWWDKTEVQVWDTTGSPSAWRQVIPPSTGLGFDVVAGAGLTGGGFPTGSPLSTTINVGAGTGITVSAGFVSTNDAQIVHANLSGYVAAEHTDHSLVVITAGDGLTGGGNLTSNITFTVGEGDGITIGSSDVSIDATVVKTLTTQQINSVKIFTEQLLGDVSGTSAAVPAYGFDLGSSDTGVYRSAANELSFSTGAVQRFRIESGGVLRALDSTYESSLSGDDDIPNKKYVDDRAASGGTPTFNTFVGTSSISGLDPLQSYLVNGYGTTRSAGTGNHTLSGVRLYRGSTTPGIGTLVAATPFATINWPDGNVPVATTFICDMNGDTAINMTIDIYDLTHKNARWMSAVQITGGAGSPILGSPLPSVGVIELNNMPASVYSGIFAGGPYYPLSSLRINSNGDGETAAGSTAAFLIYSQFGDDWLISGGPASAFEVKAETVSVLGSHYTLFGTVSSWLPLTSQRSWTIERSTFNAGFNNWVLDVEVRQISNPANTTGVQRITLEVEQGV